MLANARGLTALSLTTTNHGTMLMSDDILSEMEADASSRLELPPDDKLKSVSKLADNMLLLERIIAEREGQLAEAKKRLNQLCDEDLPQLMAELNISSFKLKNGEEVEVRNTYGAHIKEANKEAAFAFLRESGLGDIIKNTVSVAFGKGEDAMAESFVESAERQGYVPQQKTAVHPQTLKAWVRERIENGESIPTETFGVFAGQKAIIRRPK